MKLSATTTKEAATLLLTLRQYQPFRFGGKWFVSEFHGSGVAYRTKSALLKAAGKAGVTSLEFAVIE